jgi:hypothetical protein
MSRITQCNNDAGIPIVVGASTFADLQGVASAAQLPSIMGTAIPTLGIPSPTPAFGIEAPAGQNPGIYVQDENGAWHQQAGMDLTNGGDVNGPPSPRGTLTWYRRMYFRDNQSLNQGFKNAAISIQHEAGVGTINTNQDRAVAVSMQNPTGTIVSIAVTSNVVRIAMSTPVATTAESFKVGHVIVPTGLTTNTFLNNQVLTVQSITIVNASSMFLFCPFVHADVAGVADTGSVNLQVYSMACLQMEMDVYGTPVFLPRIDNEVSTLSLQMSDNHLGGESISSLGCHCARLSYFRAAGAGTWNTAGGLNIGIANNSAVDMGLVSIHGIVITASDNAAAPNGIYAAIDIFAPSPRFSNSNYGLFIRDFGANAADQAIRVVGGKVNLGPGQTTVGTLVISSVPTGDPHVVGQIYKDVTGALFVSAG